MPVEIRELVIRATVIDDSRGGSASREPSASRGTGMNKEQIVQECVEQVLSILERKKER